MVKIGMKLIKPSLHFLNRWTLFNMPMMPIKMQVNFVSIITFLISNANGAFVFYDEENETKLKYLVAQLNRADNFPVQMLRFDALQDIADEMADEMNQ
jgi:uncharacterized phage-like protein YoqJ